MKRDTIQEQVTAINRAFHVLIYDMILDRPDYATGKLQRLGFIDLHVMAIAAERPDLILREIREYLKIPQTTLSSIVTKLEKLKLVKRVINKRDMRSFSIRITKAGRDILDEHRRIDREQAERMLKTLNENERAEFVRLFVKAAEAARKTKSKVSP